MIRALLDIITGKAAKRNRARLDLEEAKIAQDMAHKAYVGAIARKDCRDQHKAHEAFCKATTARLNAEMRIELDL